MEAEVDARAPAITLTSAGTGTGMNCLILSKLPAPWTP